MKRRLTDARATAVAACGDNRRMLQTPIEWLPDSGAPEQLIVLLHGWCADGRAMAPLAQALRLAFPQAAVIAPDAPHAADGGRRGRQWYPVDGLTPQNWAERVGGALPLIEPFLRLQQQRLGVTPAATALGGFSQGAILSLETVALHDGIAGRVLAFGGCYVRPPEAAPRLPTVHLFHGGADQIIPADGSRNAMARLAELKGDATVDIADDIGHEVHPVLIDCALQRLRTHIPLRTWQAALGAVPPLPGTGDHDD